MLVLLGFLCGVSQAVILGVNAECDLPSSVWCDNEEDAAKCQVLDQCERYVWSRVQPPGGKTLVGFSLYTEALCPGCKQFMVSQLYPTWKKIGEIMNITVVPYGNTKESKHGNKWKFRCQHGKEECIGDIIETCAIYFYTDVNQHLPFLYCIENSNEKPHKVAPKCAKTYGLDYTKILSCTNSSLGNKLQHEMAMRTQDLKPPHQFVPWVTLNGVHTDDIQDKAEEDLLKLICDSYTGKKPDACKETSKLKDRCFKNQVAETLGFNKRQ